MLFWWMVCQLAYEITNAHDIAAYLRERELPERERDLPERERDLPERESG